MRYRVCEGVLRAQLEGEEVLLNPSTGMYHLLNATGRQLLAEFDRGLSLEQAATVLAESVGIEAEQVRTDSSAFIADMIERGLLEEAP
jgi:hypothetical protein